MSFVAEAHTDLNRLLLGRQYAVAFGVLGLFGSLIVAVAIAESKLYKDHQEDVPAPFWLVPIAVGYGMYRGWGYGQFEDSIGIQYVHSPPRIRNANTISFRL